MNESEQDQFIIFLEPARAELVDYPTDAEAAAVQAHFTSLQHLTEEGTVLLAGRTTEPPHVGIIVLQADDRAAAEQIMAQDPGIQAGVFKARLQTYHIALRSKQA